MRQQNYFDDDDYDDDDVTPQRHMLRAIHAIKKPAHLFTQSLNSIRFTKF